MRPVPEQVTTVLAPYLQRIAEEEHGEVRPDDLMLDMWHGESLPMLLNTLCLEAWEHGLLVRDKDGAARWMCKVYERHDGQYSYGGTLFRVYTNQCLLYRIEHAVNYIERALRGAAYCLLFMVEYNAVCFGVIDQHGTEWFVPLLHSGYTEAWEPQLLTRTDYSALVEHNAAQFHSF